MMLQSWQYWFSLAEFGCAMVKSMKFRPFVWTTNVAIMGVREIEKEVSVYLPKSHSHGTG